MQPSTPASGTERRAEARERSAFALMTRVMRHRSASIGAVIVATFLVATFVGPEVAPHDPFKISPIERLQGPTLDHPMGTDELGRDLLSRVLLGGRYSLIVGLLSTLVGAVMGVTLGVVAGTLRGPLEQVIMRGIDVLAAFPGILLALAIVAALGPGLSNLIVALGLSSVPLFGRLSYGLTLTTVENEYVTAAKSLGTSTGAVMGRHILPNIIPTIAVQYALRVATVILLAASLGFIGLGVQPPNPEWGALLANAREYMRSAPHVAVFPGLAIASLVLGLNLLGDGLRDVLDPKLRSMASSTSTRNEGR